MKILIIALLLSVAWAAVEADRLAKVPGFGPEFNTSVYSGYLNTGDSTRQIHYVFVESKNGKNNKDPVTLWLNGGPGCSSMLGFLQEIGPYYLEEGIDYKKGDNLTWNEFSWHNLSNLLFFESPAGVGFSYNLNTTYQYDDYNTCQDNFDALQDFFKKYSEYLPNQFWIAGESYAGKYIPDLAVQIDKFNTRAQAGVINFKGILVGNGVMSFEDGQLQNSEAEYMVDHSFVDPEILSYYEHSCKTDPHSAGCNFFHQRLEENTEELNPYNVYSYCFYNDSFDATGRNGEERKRFESQETMLFKLLEKARGQQNTRKSRFNGAPCAYFDGVFDYFNLNRKEYNAKFDGMTWNGPCAENITYHIDLAGSMAAYRILLSRMQEARYQIVLYNGDWDDVVPYHDTVKGIKNLYLSETFTYHPWFTGRQHSGFRQLYSGIVFMTVKGASHQVPQSKRVEAFQMFKDILAGHLESLVEESMESE